MGEYFWYDPFNPKDFSGFVLVGGCYQPLEPDDQGWFTSDRLGLTLRTWTGEYRGIETTWIRWATLTGEVLPTAQELAIAAQQAVQAAQQEAQAARQKAAALAAQLRALGIDPDAV